jgi:hypothetical protein
MTAAFCGRKLCSDYLFLLGLLLPAPVFVFVFEMNGPLGGAGLDIPQNAFQLNQCLGIGRALRVQQGIEIFDGNRLLLRTMADVQLRFPVEIRDSNLLRNLNRHSADVFAVQQHSQST